MIRGPRLDATAGAGLSMVLLTAFPAGAQQTPVLPPAWIAAPPVTPSGNWEVVQDLRDLPPEFLPENPRRNPAELAANPRTSLPYESPGIYGIGAGIRVNEASGKDGGTAINGLITGRLGYKIGSSVALSVRPSYIYVPNNQNRSNNNRNRNNSSTDNETRLPLTLDLFPRSTVSPYFGGGIATNTHGSGATDPLITAGVDLRLYQNLTLGLNVNYIVQSESEGTDWEAMTLLYLRF